MMPFVGVQAQQFDKSAVLGQARQAYYSLRGEGLESFRCDITPNWANLLKEASKQNPRNAAGAIKFLNQLHFTVTLAADGSVKFTHNEVASKDKSREVALRQIYDGMEQMTVGFFETWKLFMLTPPFPRVTSDYQLESTGSQYKLSYRDGEAGVVTAMGTDFAISRLSVRASEFDSSIEPKFAATPKGFVLTGYEADYQTQKPEETTKLSVRIGYRQVSGLQMLQRLDLHGTYGNFPYAVELTFSNCEVTKRPPGVSQGSDSGRPLAVLVQSEWASRLLANASALIDQISLISHAPKP